MTRTVTFNVPLATMPADTLSVMDTSSGWNCSPQPQIGLLPGQQYQNEEIDLFDGRFGLPVEKITQSSQSIRINSPLNVHEDLYRTIKPTTPTTTFHTDNLFHGLLRQHFLLQVGARLLRREVLANLDVLIERSPYQSPHDPLDENSCVVFTGASRGLGEEVIKKLAQESRGKIVLVARSAKVLQELIDNLQPTSQARLIALPFDLGNNGSGAALGHKLEEMGLIPTTLVNNAGLSNNKNAIDVTPDKILQEMNVNFLSQMQLILTIGDDMERLGRTLGRRPKIICIGSMACITGFAGNSTYGATRAAMLKWLRGFRWEVGPSYPSLHYIAYGPLDTESANDYKKPYLPRMSVSAAANVMIETIKEKRSKFFIIPGFTNKLVQYIDPWMPIVNELMMVMVTGAIATVRQRQVNGYASQYKPRPQTRKDD